MEVLIIALFFVFLVSRSSAARLENILIFTQRRRKRCFTKGVEGKLPPKNLFHVMQEWAFLPSFLSLFSDTLWKSFLQGTTINCLKYREKVFLNCWKQRRERQNFVFDFDPKFSLVTFPMMIIISETPAWSSVSALGTWMFAQQKALNNTAEMCTTVWQSHRKQDHIGDSGRPAEAAERRLVVGSAWGSEAVSGECLLHGQA